MVLMPPSFRRSEALGVMRGRQRFGNSSPSLNWRGSADLMVDSYRQPAAPGLISWLERVGDRWSSALR